MNKRQKLILEVLKTHPDSWCSTDLLITALKIKKPSDVSKMNKALDDLVRRDVIQRNKKGAYKISGVTQDDEIVEGVFTSSRSGIGFVRVEGYDTDIKIPPKRAGLALEDDRVRVRLQRNGRFRRLQGTVIDVISRGRNIFVGTLIRQGKNAYYIESDRKSARVDFFVHPENIKNASHNDKVVFRLLDWVHPGSLPEAEVMEVLGRKGSHNAEVLSILAENQLPGLFPPEVEKQAAAIPLEIPHTEYERRLDLRSEDIFTIDPVDAKDFDDALSIKILENGNYYLGVHIADVTYYVEQDTLLDVEALNRATSVYLVDRVIPMLPEKLSNGVCSLRPHEDKLTFSCFMEITPQGEVTNYSIRESVINSKQRFTYEEAQAVIDGKKNPFSRPIRQLASMSRMLTAKRFREGSLDFDSPEPLFVLDKKGKPLYVEIKERLAAHRLVEECMLMANKTVAIHVEHLRERSGKRKNRDLYPFVYRVHDKPDAEKLQNISEMVRPAGIDFRFKKDKVSVVALNKLLQEVKNTNLEYFINELMLRSMAKAEYSPKNIGHYGLGFKNYTHFTSPIRRYPDVIVHRLIKRYNTGRSGYPYQELKRLGEHCSEREREAVSAERDSVKLKQVEYMSERIGGIFDGVISGVTDKGLFVILKDIYCEGLVPVRELTNDYYIFDQRRHSLTGRHKGKEYQLGMEVKVKVVHADVTRRMIDFVMA